MCSRLLGHIAACEPSPSSRQLQRCSARQSAADVGLLEFSTRALCVALEVVGVLHEVCEKERLTLPDELAARIAKASGRNLRRAILALEECKVAQYPFTADQEIQELDWAMYIKETVAQIVLTHLTICQS